MISCIIITAFSIGTVMNTRPVIFAALAEENNFSPGQMAVCYTVTLISSALSVSPIAKIYNGKTAKKVLLILGIFVCVSMALGRIFSSLWRWYFLCVFMGIGSGSIMMLLCVTLNSRFAEKSPGIIGIVTASGGAAGILVNPICSYMIKILSRKKTAVIFSAISLSVYLFALLFMFAPSETQKEKPEYSPDKAEFKNIKFITALLGDIAFNRIFPCCKSTGGVCQRPGFRQPGGRLCRQPEHGRQCCRQTCLWGGGKESGHFQNRTRFLCRHRFISCFVLFCRCKYRHFLLCLLCFRHKFRRQRVSAADFVPKNLRPGKIQTFFGKKPNVLQFFHSGT